jgi:hypothetical protein
MNPVRYKKDEIRKDFEGQNAIVCSIRVSYHLMSSNRSGMIALGNDT